MKKISQVLAFFMVLLSGILVELLSKNTLLALFTMVTIFLGAISIFLYLRFDEYFNSNKNSSEKIMKEIGDIKKCISCCGLQAAGFSQIFENAKKSLSLTLNLISKNYKFLGVSAEKVLKETPKFRQILDEKIQDGATFEFLLLDPKAEDIVKVHALRENEDSEALKKRLESFITELYNLGVKYEGKIKVYLYRDLPLFRVVIIDDENCFVSFYGAKGKEGVDVPQLLFLKDRESFFLPFERFYERIKEGATKYSK